ncbi:MAG: hypothetical protein V4631_13015 [Pseudomonadota bacterium]
MKLGIAIVGAILLTACAGASAQVKKSCYTVEPFQKEVGYCQAVKAGNTL